MENVESSACRSIPGHSVLSNPSAAFPVNHHGNRSRPHHQILAIALVAGVAAGLLCLSAVNLPTTLSNLGYSRSRAPGWFRCSHRWNRRTPPT